MDVTPDFLLDEPRWQRQARPRLAISFFIATLLIAVVLALLQFPVAQVIRPGPEILIRLLPAMVEPLAGSPPEISEAAAPESEALRSRTPEPEALTDAADEPGASGIAEAVQDPPDWYGQIDAAAKVAVDEMNRIDSVNPVLDQKRREAAQKFYPSRAPEQREIWDNVETDQLGRKILVNGGCYRIVDDYSAANYDIFRDFQQHLVYCSMSKSAPEELPWVEQIRDRYLYLKYPDGEIPEDELAEYVERK